MFRYGGHNVQLDSSFKFGVDNLTPAFLKKFPLGKVIMVVMIRGERIIRYSNIIRILEAEY